MKIYIVTDGCYSDYCIERVFSNRLAAEEYKKWHNIRNDIEEYEVHDEPFDQHDGEKVMFIGVRGTVYPEAVVDIRYDIRPDLINPARRAGSAGIIEYHTPHPYVIHLYRYIPADKWDEEKYKAKYTKALYDLAAIAKAMFAEGASIRDVDQALRNEEIEE